LNTKLKCLLLDDELPGLTYLKMLCDQLPELDVVKAFNSPETFLKEATNLEFDLCILDIEMPGVNGIKVASLLNNKPVIFTTAYKEYAVDAFDLDAIDFVRKPVQRERLQQAVQKAVKRIGALPQQKAFIQLNTDKGKSLIFFDQLLFITTSQSDSRDKIAHLSDGNQLTVKNMSFEKLHELLPPDKYCRVNKREMIAVNIVQSFSYDEITTSITTSSAQPLKFSLSETYRSDFLKSIGAK
jgi:DNA-binding LytR/AlgR family response regulator